MVWSRFGLNWDPWREMQSLQRQMNRWLESSSPFSPAEDPVVNVWKNADGVLVTAEVPGATAKDLDLSVVKNTLTIRWTRKPEETEKSGRSYHRRERGSGTWVRSISLPYFVDPERVEAKHDNGVLEIRLPRAEADKPKQISVN